MNELYREAGLDIYEKVHYGSGEHIREVEDMLSWYRRRNTRVLDIGCSGGLHVLEFAKRGFATTGIDIEASAIERAKQRNRDEGLNAVFYLRDLEHDAIADLGSYDLIYSVGNVISHVNKACIGQVFKKIITCLAGGGIFLFDVLIIGSQFPEEVREDDLGIVWQRRVSRETGEIDLSGKFVSFGIIQDFHVWGYNIEEVIEILVQSGFCAIEFSDKLDFSYLGTQSAAPFCLRFRAQAQQVT